VIELQTIIALAAATGTSNRRRFTEELGYLRVTGTTFRSLKVCAFMPLTGRRLFSCD
jgi:hypothetical protein